MIQCAANVWLSVLLLAGVILFGCSRNAGPPPPLAADKIPIELPKAFNKAGQEAKDLVAKVISSLQTKDYPTAYEAVQALGAVPDTTEQQRSFATRATLTIYGLLQEAQAQGDDKAAAAIRYHQMSK